MKKSAIVVPILLLGTVLTGCSYSPNPSTNTSTKQSVTAKIATSYYQSLSKTDKKKIKFKFSKDKDETKNNQVGETFVISVKITNDSNKIVKFDKSKFLLYEGETHKIPSSKTGIAMVKPGKNITINQLLEDVDGQSLVGNDCYFIYMNMDNKLAKTLTVMHMAKPEDNNNVSSENTQQKEDTVASSDDNRQTQNDNTNDNSDSQQASSNGVPDPKQAYEKLNMDDVNDYNDMHLYRGNGVWSYVDDWGESWEVYDDGRVKGPGDPEPVMPEN